MIEKYRCILINMHLEINWLLVKFSRVNMIDVDFINDNSSASSCTTLTMISEINHRWISTVLFTRKRIHHGEQQQAKINALSLEYYRVMAKPCEILAFKTSKRKWNMFCFEAEIITHLSLAFELGFIDFSW